MPDRLIDEKPRGVSPHTQAFVALSGSGLCLMLRIDMELSPPDANKGLQRRAAVRYRLRLPVIFHWNDGQDHTEGGFTVDVALDGAFIVSSRCPPVGSDVRIEVLLPSLDDASEMRIECAGRVMRVVNGAGGVGFGVRGTFDDDHLTQQAGADDAPPSQGQ